VGHRAVRAKGKENYKKRKEEKKKGPGRERSRANKKKINEEYSVS